MFPTRPGAIPRVLPKSFPQRLVHRTTAPFFFSNVSGALASVVAVSGSINGDTGEGSFGALGELTLNEGTSAGFVALLDDGNEFSWRAKITHPSAAIALGVLVTADAVYCCIRGVNSANPQNITVYNSDDTVFSAVSQAIPADSYAAQVVKYDRDGMAQWVKRVWGAANSTDDAACHALSLKLDPSDGNIIVTGRAGTDSFSGDWDLEIGDPGDTGYDDSHTGLDERWQSMEVQAKLSASNGEALNASLSRPNTINTFLALNQQTGNLSVSASGLRSSVYDSDSNAGVFSVKWDVGGANELTEAVEYQAHAAVASWDADGNLLWVNHISDDGGTRNTCEAWRSVRADGSGVIAFGWTCNSGRTMTFESQNVGDVTLSPTDEAYYWFARYDDDGDIVWVKELIKNHSDSSLRNAFANGVLIDPDDDAFYLSGQRTVSLSGNYGHWVAKFKTSTGAFQWVTRMHHAAAGASTEAAVMGIFNDGGNIVVIWRNDEEADTLEFDDEAAAGTAVTEVTGASLITTTHSKATGERLSLVDLSSAATIAWRCSDS